MAAGDRAIARLGRPDLSVRPDATSGRMSIQLDKPWRALEEREVARLPAQLGVYLEITSKPTHGITNGHVARMAKLAGARLVLNSDNHEVAFLTPARVRAVALGAGLEEGDLDDLLVTNPEELIAKVTGRDP